MEVYHLTGQPLSTYRYKAGETDAAALYKPLSYGLTLAREVLYARLEQRVHAQLKAGLLEEVRRLFEAGYGPELSAMKGITYRQLLGYLRGDYDFDAAVALMVRDNRRYAKRQYTWCSMLTRAFIGLTLWRSAGCSPLPRIFPSAAGLDGANAGTAMSSC